MVPDPRLDALAELVQPQRILPTVWKFWILPVSSKVPAKGRIGQTSFWQTYEVDAIIHVVRCFEDDNVVHVDGSVDPVRDKEIIDLELIFKDIETMEKRIDKLKKQAKSGQKMTKPMWEWAEKIIEAPRKRKPARSFEWTKHLQNLFNDLYPHTSKPILCMCATWTKIVFWMGIHLQTRFLEAIHGEGAETILICAGSEAGLGTESKGVREWNEAYGIRRTEM